MVTSIASSGTAKSGISMFSSTAWAGVALGIGSQESDDWTAAPTTGKIAIRVANSSVIDTSRKPAEPRWDMSNFLCGYRRIGRVPPRHGFDDTRNPVLGIGQREEVYTPHSQVC